MNPILRTAFRAHTRHNFTGRAPRVAANDCRGALQPLRARQGPAMVLPPSAGPDFPCSSARSGPVFASFHDHGGTRA